MDTTLTPVRVAALVEQLRRDIKEIRSYGWEIHAMDDILLVLDPAGVEIVGDCCLPDSPIEMWEHLHDICTIDGAGGW